MGKISTQGRKLSPGKVYQSRINGQNQIGGGGRENLLIDAGVGRKARP